MYARKTILTNDVIDLVNHILENSIDGLVEGRETLASFLSTLLGNADSYNGFKYLSRDINASSTRSDRSRVEFYKISH